MQRRNRLPHALDQTIVIRECAVLFGVRGSGKDHISRRCRLSLEEFLDHEKIELRKRVLVTFELFRQETTCDVERTNRVACGVEHSTRGGWGIHHSHVVRANAVVEERQRMEEDAPVSRCKPLCQLCDGGLRRRCELATE